MAWFCALSWWKRDVGDVLSAVPLCIPKSVSGVHQNVVVFCSFVCLFVLFCFVFLLCVCVCVCLRVCVCELSMLPLAKSIVRNESPLLTMNYVFTQ